MRHPLIGQEKVHICKDDDGDCDPLCDMESLTEFFEIYHQRKFS